jgi:hypothetical protein
LIISFELLELPVRCYISSAIAYYGSNRRQIRLWLPHDHHGVATGTDLAITATSGGGIKGAKDLFEMPGHRLSQFAVTRPSCEAGTICKHDLRSGNWNVMKEKEYVLVFVIFWM